MDGRSETATIADSLPDGRSGLDWAARRIRSIAAVTAAVAVTWAVVILLVDRFQFVLFTPTTKTGFEITLALLRLFVALVLALFPDEPVRERLRWVAVGFLILGLGGLIFGYLLPAIQVDLDFNALLYGSLLSRILGTASMAIGLWPAAARRCSGRELTLVLALFAVLGGVIVAGGRWLPKFTHAESAHVAIGDAGYFREMTVWHWGLSLIPIAIAVAAAIGAIQHLAGQQLGAWLVAAMVLVAGAQLHIALWPSAFSSVLTTASFIRLGLTVTVAVGAVLELRRVAAERAALLAAERAAAARLVDLARLRADFTAMVAHELASPLAAVRRSAELAAEDALTPRQERALATIASEVGVLDSLVADVQAAGTVEREEFQPHLFPVPLSMLLADAVAFAYTLPGNHPVHCSLEVREHVRADSERIAQVLHNLLSNAAKYSPPETPITVATTRRGDRVRIEVADRGPGIGPDEIARIFEKFGRGREAREGWVAGVGLGLYVARRILRTHGSDLHVESRPGEGARFWFELEVAS